MDWHRNNFDGPQMSGVMGPSLIPAHMVVLILTYGLVNMVCVINSFKLNHHLLSNR